MNRPTEAIEWLDSMAKIKHEICDTPEARDSRCSAAALAYIKELEEIAWMYEDLTHRRRAA